MNNKFVCVDETMEKVCLYCVYCKPKFWLLRLSEERQNLLDFKNTLICVAKSVPPADLTDISSSSGLVLQEVCH